MSELSIGTTVTAIYKTGKYIGEITDIRANNYLIRVLAVLKHPMQGDLHHPKSTDVIIFNERKALSYREQMNVPKQMVKPYDEPIPEYVESLLHAASTFKAKLKEDNSDFAQRSLQSIEILEKDYYKQ